MNNRLTLHNCVHLIGLLVITFICNNRPVLVWSALVYVHGRCFYYMLRQCILTVTYAGKLVSIAEH